MSVTAGDLTGTERAVLLVLMAESRPVPNPELPALGPTLDKPGREKLNQLGLIESERVGSRFVHELTDRGWRLCRDLIDAGPPPRSTGSAKTVYTVLGALGRYLSHADLSLADVFGVTPLSTEDRIRDAYRRLAPRPGGWVSLTRLRAELEVPRADVDAALTALHRAPGVSVIPQEDQKVLTAEDRAAAVVIGDRPKHLIAIEA
ncbi:MAG: J domain-containing protein [Mycobacterium sp.]